MKAVSPNDFDLEMVGHRAGRENAHRVIAGEVAPAADHFLALRDRAACDFYLSADSACVRRFAFQADGKAWRGGIVAIDTGAGIQIVDDDIEVAVIVQVRESHAV